MNKYKIKFTVSIPGFFGLGAESHQSSKLIQADSLEQAYKLAHAEARMATELEEDDTGTKFVVNDVEEVL